MLVSYTVKLTIINNTTNSSVIFNKDFQNEITAVDNLLYDNYHVLSSSIYVLDLFKEEVQDYCTTEGITENDITIDEYEIATISENVEVFFENSVDVNAFTLTPDIKCYVYPKEQPLPVPTLVGEAYDSNTIVWTWPNDSAYAHYLISEPVDFTSENDKTKIIATLPIGTDHYIETGLAPNTAYSRRLVNFTDTQTSLASAETTVTTETVNPKVSLDKYFIEREQDWTITNEEREVIKENLEAFKSGIGDINDLKVYKQMDKDFYEKFKTYVTLTGKFTKREKRYDQVGFNYKVCLEATETVEEQEGEVKFKVDAYPWQECYKSEYVWAIQPVTIHAKVYATIDLFKEGSVTVNQTVTGSYKAEELVPATSKPTSVIIVLDLSSSMRYPTSNGASNGTPSYGRLNKIKTAAKNFIDSINAVGITDIEYVIVGFATTGYAKKFATAAGNTDLEVASTKAALAKECINSMYCGSSASGTGRMDGDSDLGNMTDWGNGLDKARCTKENVGLFFFTDGFPTHPEPIRTDSMCKDIKARAKAFMTAYPKAFTYCFFASKVSNTDADLHIQLSDTYKTSVRDTLLDALGADLANRHSTFSIDDESAENVTKIFKDAGDLFAKATVKTVTETIPLTVSCNVSQKDFKTVKLESKDITFTIDASKTPVTYDYITKRAVIRKTDWLPETQMSSETLYELLKQAKESCPEWLAGYTTNNHVVDSNGNVIGDVYKNIYIKDTYMYADEDMFPNLNFDMGYEYGMQGTINVYSQIPAISTTDYADDEYVALSTSNSYVMIKGYTDAIIYEGTRYAHAMVNAYNNPVETLFYRNDLYRILVNRKNQYIHYSGPLDSYHVFKSPIDIKTPNPSYLQILNDGIDADMVVSIYQHFESPILNYRFNILDPDAYTPYYEILPGCNKESEDKHLVIVSVYYAKNVEINSEELNAHYYSSFDYTNPAQSPIQFIYGLHGTWNAMTGTFECDGQLISQYVHFYARKMTKTRPYYDELPGPGEDLMYGLVNGRYRKDNLSGKQDLIVDTPEFNIPTTVLATHADSVRIYIRVTEFWPSSALVSYKWDNENPVGSGFTKINGDYVTFSCDSLTYKDVEYKEIIGTYEMEELELFDTKAKSVLFNIPKPASIGENYGATVQPFDLEENNVAIIYDGFENKASYTFTFEGYGLTDCIFELKTKVDRVAIPFTYLEHTDTVLKIKYVLNADTEITSALMNTATRIAHVERYDYIESTSKYENIYVNVTTNNSDVLPTKYPTEIYFSKETSVTIPIEFIGLVNATSKWSPRIHNGYYYINQHEKYLYSEFNVDANFDKTENIKYSPEEVFVSFDVSMLKDGGETKNYSITKDTIAEMLQDEEHYTWVEQLNGSSYYGLTLKPAVEGWKYKHYETQEWMSPVILFDNPLTTAGTLSIDYINLDGSKTGLDLYVRSYNLEEGKWTDWVSFQNGTIPNVVLSAGYQIKTVLSASETQSEYLWDDYLCCHLDWLEYIDTNLSENLITITDHMTTGTYGTDAIAISKILKYSCPTGIMLDRYASSSSVQLLVGFSNNINDLVLENIIWQPASVATLNSGFKYYRFKAVIPNGEKLYWIHLTVKTLQTEVVLPYIKSISMTGTFVPDDITGNFVVFENYTITKDGLYHEIVPKIGDVISSKVLEKGFELSNITSINITSTNPDIYLRMDNNILKPNPDIALLNTSIQAAAVKSTIDTITKLPYIFTENNKITITGTPQQYCPIAVEDVNGNPFAQIYNVNPADMKLNEIHIISKEINYIELKRNDYELDTFQVWINDEPVAKTEYTIINHLIMFKNNLTIGDTVTVSYNKENSFYAEIDRKNNKTIITVYANAGLFNLSDTYTENGVTYHKKYKVIFETNSNNNKLKAKDLSLNPVYRTEYDGFIYLTDERNTPYSIKIWCNPLRVKAGGTDSVDIQIEVLDILTNPIIGRAITLDCKNGTLKYDSSETDMNGVVHAVYYSSYLAGTDTITAKILEDDDTISLQESIQIVSY